MSYKRSRQELKRPKKEKIQFDQSIIDDLNWNGNDVSFVENTSFVNVEIKEKMIGNYLGEYVLTRKKLVHGKAGIGATKSSTAITARG